MGSVDRPAIVLVTLERSQTDPRKPIRVSKPRRRDRASDSNHITRLLGHTPIPHILIAYSDGEVRQQFTFVYAAEIESGQLKIDDESKEAAWVPLLSAVEGCYGLAS
jgi:hypothetical protein